MDDIDRPCTLARQMARKQGAKTNVDLLLRLSPGRQLGQMGGWR